VHQLTVAHVGNDCAPQVQRLGTKCDIIVNSFFEEDGYPEALQHAELRKTVASLVEPGWVSCEG
jgi:hypothetical protein